MQISAFKALPSLGIPSSSSSFFGDGKLPTFSYFPKDISSKSGLGVIRASYNWPRPPPGYQEPPRGPPEGGFPQQGSPQGGFPQQGSPQGGFPQQGSPQGGFQQQGPSQGGFQQQGPPQGGFQQQGPPQGGFQQQGPPQGGFQQQGPPQGGFQQQGPSQGGFQQQGPPQGGFQQQGPPQGGFQQQDRPQGGFQQQGPPQSFQQQNFQQQPPGNFRQGFQQQGPPPGNFQGGFPQQSPPQGGFQQQGPPQGYSQGGFQQQGPPHNNFQQNTPPPYNFQQSGPPQNNGPPPPSNFQQNGPPPQNGGPPQDEFSSGTTSFTSPLPSRPLESRPKFRSRNNSDLSGSLGLNFPGSQIPGLPGSPRPKPGTPRPYDPTKQKSKVMEWLTPPKPPTELLQREHFKLSDTCSCTIFFGDLSKWTVDGKSDAVIAPANKKLNTGPAVNAVLFKAAGSKMLECTQRIPDVAPQGIKAEMGDAISTRAFDLPVSRVIHTVGSVYKKNANGVRESDAILEKAYKTALMVARKENLKYLAFPPLSCNIYGYPYADGAEVAIKTLKANCDGFLQIDIVIRNIEGYEAFIDEAHKVLEAVKEKKTLKVKLGDDGSVVSGTVVETTNAIPNSPYARTMPRIDPSLPPAAAEKAAAMAAANEAREASSGESPPPGAREYVAPPQHIPESTPVPPRERASPIPPSGPPPTPPSTPTMSYPTQYYQN